MEENQETKQKKKRKISAFGIIAIILASLVLLGFAAYKLIPSLLAGLVNTPVDPFDITDENAVLQYAPVDEAKSAKVDAMSHGSSEDTWAFYVYMVCSDLEDNDINELSQYSKWMVYDEAEEIKKTNDQKIRNLIKEFTTELDEKNAEVPKVLFNPVSTSYEYEDEATYVDPDATGEATSNINSMVYGVMSDRIKVVVQTGGARRYENVEINPNRVQRFLITDDGMDEVYNEPLYNVSTPEALGDFLTFCNENYDADHKIVILWNHGGGTNGFGYDKIYGDHLTFEEIAEGFSYAVEKDENEPYYDAIAFDACVSQVLEINHELYGYSKYMFASEELMPSTGLDYEGFLSALSEDPSMNAAQLGKVMADTFALQTLAIYAEEGAINSGTYSVVDMQKSEKAYEAYCSFCKAVLGEIKDDTSVLGELSRAASVAPAYGIDSADYVNLIDLYSFMGETASFMKDESKKVMDAVDEAVIYCRNTFISRDSKGLAVYFPARITAADGLYTFLNYKNELCESDDIKALYYYKIAGCLNDELQQAVGEVRTINYNEVLTGISQLDMKCLGDGNLEMRISNNQAELIQRLKFQLAGYNDENGDVIYYGEDTYAFVDEDGKVTTNFDCKWIALDGNILPLKLLSSTGDVETFSTDIEYNGYKAKLITSFDAETGTVSIQGVSISCFQAEEARAILPLKDGDIIIIKYETGNLNSNISGEAEEIVIYKTGFTEIGETDLSDGKYFEYITFEDLRADTYDSKIALMTIENGEVTEQMIDDTVVSYEKD